MKSDWSSSRADLHETAFLLHQFLAGELPAIDMQTALEIQILADERRCVAFGIDSDNVATIVQTRLHWLRQVAPQLVEICAQFGLSTTAWLETTWNLWLPLALQLADRRRSQNQCWIQGILGGQGTGKTTLGLVLTQILATMGYRSLSLSIDDLYKSYAERERQREHDPRLVWRGPPGTHEVELGIRLLDELRCSQPGQTLEIPRFDKSLHGGSGDRTSPERVQDIDIVLFDGWFIGARPIDPRRFDQAPSPIETEDDRTFARDSNAALAEYLPLWERLDSLWVLYPVDYRLSKLWRKHAEHQMKASGKAGMSDADIDAFVDYFWKALHPDLFIQPLIMSSAGAKAGAELVIEIQADHSPGAVYRSGGG